MTKLYEIKERIFQFCSRHEVYLNYVWKFVIALLLFVIINGNIGFFDKINSPILTAGLALICGVMPIGFTLFAASVLVLLHLYVLSIEVAFTTLIVFIIVFLLYFRFSPQDAMLFAMTPIMCTMGIPYILPIATGLLRKGQAVASVIGGIIVYYFLNGIYKNISVFQATTAGADFEGAKLSAATGQLLENIELYLILVVFTASTLVVYIIRKMSIKHAWKIAIIAGIVIQTTGLLVGYIWFNVTEKVFGMLLGNILATGLAFMLEFLFMNLDYNRTESVQFEDDEYYYFVKAVPKKVIASSEKVVTEFSGFTGFAQKMKARKDAEEKVTRKNIADELEIDEELLK